MPSDVSVTFEQNCSVPAVDLFDQCLELAAARVHRQQSAVAVADQQAAVAGDGQAQRSSAGVGDDGGLAVGRDPHDAPVVDAGPDVAVGVDDDILGRVARHGDDGAARPVRSPAAGRPAVAATGPGRWVAWRRGHPPVSRLRFARLGLEQTARSSARRAGSASMASNSVWPLISGGASWTTGSPRSSARQYRPASNSAGVRKPRQQPLGFLVVEGLLGGLVLDQFDAVEVALAADVADDRQVVELLQRGAERRRGLLDVVVEALALEDVEVGQRHRRRHRVTAEGVAVRRTSSCRR